jgi:hypothetical protein
MTKGGDRPENVDECEVDGVKGMCDRDRSGGRRRLTAAAA